MAAVGRPSSYSRVIADAICLRIVAGESLAAISREPLMPHEATWYRWLRSDAPYASGLRQRYARAKEAQADREFDEIRTLADGAHELALADAAEAAEDASPSTAAKVARRRYYESLQARKLQIDARKFRVARMAPTKYGERVSMEMTTPPDQPIRLALGTDDATLASVLSMLAEAGALPPTNGESESPAPKQGNGAAE